MGKHPGSLQETHLQGLASGFLASLDLSFLESSQRMEAIHHSELPFNLFLCVCVFELLDTCHTCSQKRCVGIFHLSFSHSHNAFKWDVQYRHRPACLSSIHGPKNDKTPPKTAFMRERERKTARANTQQRVKHMERRICVWI